ncbi:ComEC/Rec2 family competence protein [Galbibacter sp. EGI 63066]|uniref:ComEC/Rec2 family competence protein n=1 Tax=Galbibacter sp. EGI 63066 TaxID=2993559 RepID=UPI00224911F0|nr:ComEC/Rec2 family competence protein [Galbibacter sp. EGI 63066]MCX2679960.1 ComEC/Rec2 family competence protein [Galbibacter sp. EGI 63066]
MKILNYPILKLLLFLVLGIGIGYLFHFEWLHILFGIGLISILLLITNRNLKFAKKPVFGFLICLVFLLIGIFSVEIRSYDNRPHYYKHHYQTGQHITFRISKRLKPNDYNYRYEADIIAIGQKKSIGKLLVVIAKDSTEGFTTPEIDYTYTTTALLQEISPPLNPHQFDYKLYLERRQITHQLYLKPSELELISTEIKTVNGYANTFRQSINKKLKKYQAGKEEMGVLNALLLGQRQDIPDETYDNYAAAGAIHLLAISGLHIGIILMFLSFLLKPLERIKHGKTIKTILILLILWLFAVVAGLSASVVRAVTMFSFIAYAMNLKREVNTYHALIASMFVLLLFKPAFIFDVGFQLSYTAVFGIVWMQPVLEGFWNPKHKPITYFWKLLTVTTAAQLSVLPLSLYYFHQFPGLFFVSNLVLVPTIGLLLGFGFVVIILALFNFLPEFLANSFFISIKLMNTFIDWIALKEDFIFRNIHFDFPQLIVSYTLIISFFLLLKKRSLKSIGSFSTGLLAFLAILAFNNYQQKHQFIVFHKSRSSLLAHQKAGILHTNQSKDLTNSYILNNYLTGENLELQSDLIIDSIINLNHEKLLIVDSLGNYNTQKKIDYVLLSYSPKINLNRLISQLQPKKVIADGSNYTSFVKRWKKTCREQKIPFHYTGEKGAFVILME